MPANGAANCMMAIRWQARGPRGQELLRLSIRDLASPEELRELGLAVYLDRPLGDAKGPAEPDRTPLLASLAFSRSVARQRLQLLQGEPVLATEAGVFDACMAMLKAGAGPKGLPVQQIGPCRRPTVVSLTDARRAAADFVFLATLPGSIAELLALIDSECLAGQRPVLAARSPRGDSLLLYDVDYRPCLEVHVDASAGYAVRANKEYPLAGLRVTVLAQDRQDDQSHFFHRLDVQEVQAALDHPGGRRRTARAGFAAAPASPPSAPDRPRKRSCTPCTGPTGSS